MTPSETEQLEKAQNAIKKLAATELQIDETLFLLTMYFRYHWINGRSLLIVQFFYTTHM